MKLLLPILLGITLHTSAQKVEQYFDYAWKPTEDIGRARYYAVTEKQDSLWLRKDYFLQEKKLQMAGTYRDKETKVAHGRFQFFHATGSVESYGLFVNGKKHGPWLRFYNDGMMHDSTVYENGRIIGTSLGYHRNGYISDSSIYKSDGSGIAVYWSDNGNPTAAGNYSAERKMHGKWQFFHNNGQLSSLEVYDKGLLQSKQYFSEDGKEITDTTSIDRGASFPGGQKAWMKYLQKGLYFPSQYQITGAEQVVVVVDWAIDEDGNIVDAWVSAPFHPDFDKIALELIRKSPKWLPCINHNRRIKDYRRQPVTFSQ